MSELDELLDLAKSSVTRAATRLLDHVTPGDSDYAHSLDLQREIKAAADLVMEQEILQILSGAGLPMLSEERGYIASPQASRYWFVVDPLDGTFNFVKGLGPSAISVALWENQRPVFGVIYSLADRQLVWGGVGLGAFAGTRTIAVSATSFPAKASICTGLPVRFDINSDAAMLGFWRTVKPYAKVRMLGSAASSLQHVAQGSADAYWESHIMLWDVAAGIAIVEGAGGKCVFERIGDTWCYDVFASNPVLAQHYMHG